MIQLSTDQLAIVRAILARHLPDRDVMVFGSRARGDARPMSDLDLAVLGAEAMDISVRSAIEEAFCESDLPMKVDLLDWSMTAESFRRLIERDAKPIPLG
jgi:uncharacterized protein